MAARRLTVDEAPATGAGASGLIEDRPGQRRRSGQRASIRLIASARVVASRS